MAADLSVIIVSYNTCELLAECLDSLGEWLERGQVIVVDNASTDDSAAMVRARFPQVRLVANTTNTGYASANNQGIRLSTGQYLLLLNPDTQVNAAGFHRLVAFMNDHPAAGAVGLKLLNADGSLQPSGRCFPTLASTVAELLPVPATWRRRARGELEQRDYDQVCEVDEVSGAALCVRRRALDEVGALDESFFFLGEDIDLCWRLKTAGWKVFYLPTASVVHYGGGSRNQVHSFGISLLAQRGYYLLFRKHRPGIQAAALKGVLFFLTGLKLLKWLVLSVLSTDRKQVGLVLRAHSSELRWLWRN